MGSCVAAFWAVSVSIIVDSHAVDVEFEVELADALIRIYHLGGAMGFDLGAAVQEKMAYNATRADHKPENRAKEGGKKI